MFRSRYFNTSFLNVGFSQHTRYCFTNLVLQYRLQGFQCSLYSVSWVCVFNTVRRASSHARTRTRARTRLSQGIFPSPLSWMDAGGCGHQLTRPFGGVFLQSECILLLLGFFANMFQAFLRIVLGEKSSLLPGPLALFTGSLDVDDGETVHFSDSGPLPLLPHRMRKRWLNFLRLKASSSSPLYWIVRYPMPKRFITFK